MSKIYWIGAHSWFRFTHKEDKDVTIDDVMNERIKHVSGIKNLWISEAHLPKDEIKKSSWYKQWEERILKVHPELNKHDTRTTEPDGLDTKQSD